MSAAADLRERYLAAVLPGIPDDLPELKVELARFVRHPSKLVEPLPISEQDKALLVEVGLPQSAAPFLAFESNVVPLLSPVEQRPRTAIIGFNGSGDWIALDLDAAGAVVEFNHDDNMARTVLNSSVSSLLFSLCAFAEWDPADGIEAFAKELRDADEAAARPDAWWICEAEMAVDSWRRRRG